ncbi:unnamed protein product, partial [Meganyctiphanes norvegica]
NISDTVESIRKLCNISKNDALQESLDIIWGPMHITYQILFPLFISMGILFNLATIAVLKKISFQEYPINRYLMVIAGFNIVYNIFLIPISVTNNGCLLNTASSVEYYTRFGWALPECLLMARSYTVMSIAYDRFLGIYFPYYYYFKDINKFKTFRNRMIGIVVFSVVMTIPVVYFAEIEAEKINGITKYKTNDFYRPDVKDKVELFFQSTVEIIQFWIPMILLLVFNTFVVVAMIQRKIEKPLQVVSGPIRNEKFYFKNTTLVMTMMVYLLFQLPMFFYISNPDKTRLIDGLCHNCYGVEVHRAVGNAFEWSLSVLHIVPILIMNDGAKFIVIDMLKTCKQYILSCLVYCSHRRSFNITEANSVEEITL